MNRRLMHHLPVRRGALAISIALGIAATGAMAAQWALLAYIVGRVFLHSADLSQVWPTLLLFFVAGAARAMLVGAREATSQRMAICAKSAVRDELVAHLERLGPSYCAGERTGELVATAMDGVERLDAYVGRYLPQVALSVAIPLGLAAVLAPVDAVSAVLLLATAPVIPVLMFLVGTYAEGRIRAQWEALAQLSAHLLDLLQALPTLALYGRAEAEGVRVAKAGERYRERTMGVLRMAFLSGFALEFLVMGAIGVVAVALGVRLINGDITFERAFFVLLLTPEFYRPLRDLGTYRHAAMEGTAALERLAAILETPAPVAAERPAATLVLVGRLSERRLAVALHDVSYTYAGAGRPALAGVSFALHAGTRTAVVGRSGAGKSTLINVLLRFLDAQGGEIIANGVQIKGLAREQWRHYVALVPQRPYLFTGSVAENLRLARPGATDGELRRAAELAGAAEFIARLPREYETSLGERGTNLSAGQAQRLAVARAFLKDAPLLVLDEPTSSLDPESELCIREALATLTAERTVLVVAHRLSTVAAAERIVVLEAGRVAEAGTHAELLRRGGAYARLVGVAGAAEVPT